MFNLLISLAAFALVAVALYFTTGIGIVYSSLIGLVVFATVYFLLMRMIMKKVGAVMEIAQRDLQNNRVEKVIKTLEGGLELGQWQFFVRPQINAQIGTVLYLKKDFAEAFEYLKKGFVRHWVAMGMLAITYMKKNKNQKMIETFEKGVSGSKKEPVLWNLYAYCLEKTGEREKAISVMERAIKKIPDHELLKANLEALREGRKMKMMPYGDLWYQFHLEKTGAIMKQQTRAVQGRRKMVRR